MLKFLPKKHILAFLLCSLLLTLIWFRHGNVMGGGETGLPFYKLYQMFKISGWTWGTQALGNNNSLTVASGPFFGFFTLLQNIGLPGFLLQASFYFAILFFTLYSMYLLTDTLFPNLSAFNKSFASFFYLFNLYSVMNIWNRNLPNTIVFYALLPLLMALYIRGLKSQKYINAFYTTVLTAIFSYAFGAPAQTLIFWLVIFLITLFHRLFNRNRKFVVEYFMVHIPLWIIFNFWWISQEVYYRLSNAFKVNTEFFFNDAGNKYTFDVLSQSLGQLSNLFLLKHGTFFRDNKDLPFSWPLFYSHPLTLALQWIVILLILFVAIRKIKDKAVGFLLLFLMVGIFAAKGNTDPLGDIFDFLFQKISLLQFFRNPFEKLGLLIPLSLAPLFALAVSDIRQFLVRKNKLLLYVATFFFLSYTFLFIGFVFWTSLIFTSNNPPANDPSIGYQVKPPDYYKQADAWLSSQKNGYRLVTFPLGGEGIFYKWPKGYAGIELSGILFNTPGITYLTTIPYFSEVVQKLEKLLLTKVDFYKIANLLNVKYLILREDINEDVSGMRSAANISKVLDERIASDSAHLRLASSFGALKIYSFSDEVLLPKIYPSSTIIKTNKLGDIEDFLIGHGDKNDVIIYDKDQKFTHKLESPQTKASIIHTQANFYFNGPNELPFSNEPTILPYSEHLPTDLFFPLVNLREKFSLLSIQDQERKTEYEILLLGKRLVETQKAIETGNYNAAVNALIAYQKNFPYVFGLIQNLPPSLNIRLKIWKPDYLMLAFGTHLTLLGEFEKVIPKDNLVYPQIKSTQDLVRSKLIDLKILPQYRLATTSNFPIHNRFIYQFLIDTDGEYEVILPEASLDKYYILPNELTIQIDDKILQRKLSYTPDNLISLGKVNFTAGIHEIGFNLPNGINLVSSAEPVTIKAEHDDQKQDLKLPINNFDPYSTYLVSLDYYIRSGASPKVSLLQNNDRVIKDKRTPRLDHERVLPTDNYWFDFRSYSTYIKPDSSADAASIGLSVEPWNDCEQILKAGLRHLKCFDSKFRKSFDRISETQLKNIKVTKAFLDDPLLRKIENVDKVDSPSLVKFTRLNQTKYLVSIKNAQKPFLLIFSELFNSDWKVYSTPEYDVGENNVIWKTWRKKSLFESQHFLVNGYANGWLIDQKGDFNLVLEYWPQRLLYIGYLVSGLSVIMCLVLIIYLKAKRRSNETVN